MRRRLAVVSACALTLVACGGDTKPAPDRGAGAKPAAQAADFEAVASGSSVKIVARQGKASLVEETVEGPVLDVWQSAHGPYLFVAPSSEDLAPYFMGLYHVGERRWRMRLPHDESLDTPSCLGTAPSGRLAAFEGGTSVSAREVLIFDLDAGRTVLRVTAYGQDGPPARWTDGDALEFEVQAGVDVPGQPRLPADGGKVYVQKAVWKAGQESRRPEYRAAVVE